jgi:PAS domain S-box-containing protein
MENKDIKILAIDDNKDNLISLNALIKEVFPNAVVLTALDGIRGLEIAAKENPDVILLDVVMPNMDGFEVCTKLKADKKLSDIPVVFITALKGDKESRIRALEVGGEAFLAKPIDEYELTAQIRAMAKIKIAKIQKTNEKERLTELVEAQTHELKATHKATLNLLEDLNEENEARKKIEEILRHSEEKYRTIFENVQDVFYQTDLEGTVLEISPSIKHFSEFSREEIIGSPVANLYYNPDDREIFLNIIKETGELRDYELTLRTKTGVVKHVSINARLAFDSEGNPHHIDGAIRDITERIQSQETLKESELRFRLLFDKAPLGYQSLDIDGNFIDTNQAWLDTLGYERDEVIGKWFGSFLTPMYQEGFRKRFPIFKAQGKIHSEFEMIHKNGDIRFIAFDGRIGTDINGAFKQTHCILKDITEQKKAEIQIQENNEQIEAQNKELQLLIKELNHSNAELLISKEKAEESDHLKTAFLHNISHEIRTPMNSIVGFAEFLTDPDLTMEKRSHFTNIIVNSSYQLLSIISDIVSIATIEAGQEKIVEKDVNLNSSLKMLLDQFVLKVNSQEVGIILKHLLPDNEVTIKTDETKLVQVISNLIGNAIKFTKKGYINFGYKLKGNELEFFVEDTGIGIPADKYQDIFNRFSQVESTTARQFGGSGLGLSISKAYVELLGGKIWLKSELGKGSTFYFTLPYKKTANDLHTDNYAINTKQTKQDKLKTLLIAEDEESNFLLLEELLSSMNFNIIKATNGFEAVEICKSGKQIDLVLMDIKMPVMDGYEATRLIKSLNPNLPVIAQTAYSTEIDRSKVLACGCSDFISKPIKKELLISKIQEHLYK